MKFGRQEPSSDLRVGVGGEIVAGGEGQIAFELLDQVFVCIGIGVAVEDRFYGFAGDGFDEFVFGAFFFGEGHFDFAAATGDEVVEIADAGDDALFAGG